MYKHKEPLKMLRDYVSGDGKVTVKKGETVTFIKTMDTRDITKSYVVVEAHGVFLTIPELIVVPTTTNLNDVLKDVNNRLIAHDPSLKRYHHNFFMRMYYRIIGFFKKETKNPDLTRLKKIINEEDKGGV